MLLRGLTNLFFFGVVTSLNTSSLVNNTQAIEDAIAASTHNIYLVTCVPRPRRRDTPDFSAIAYFENPIPSDSTRPRDLRADQSAVVSSPPEAWEGVKWRVSVWRRSIFSSEITADAKTLQKGGVAGTAALDEEQFACFRDGETVITVRQGRRGPGRGRGEAVDCVADYWCASLS